MIQFTSHGQTVSLSPGGHFARPRESGFRDTPAADLHSLIDEVKQGRPWREAVHARYARDKQWLYRIITEPSRTLFFEQLLPAGGGPVLDIGAGWGQIARPLAERGPVVAFEPVAERLAFIRAAAEQDRIATRMFFVESDYFEVDFITRFAAICVIGVLEWAGANQSEMDPQERQRRFLRKVRGELADDGTLVLAIENRLGLKYLLGCSDDHIGLPNIACLPAALARARYEAVRPHPLQSFTYSLDELERLLREAGFSRLEFYGAFPDYKLPVKIVPLADHGRALNEWLRQEAPPSEHDGYTGENLDPTFQQTLATQYRALAIQGIAQHFVPSFFVAARR